jgi:non-specific serine/threonine protein kinase
MVNWGVDRDEEHVRRAEAIAREVLEADPENAQALFVLAFIRASRGNMPEAISYALRAHNREPANPDVLLVLTAAYSALGRAEETLRYGRRTAEVDPLTPMSRWVAGWSYLMTGDPERARARISDAERLESGDSVFGLFTGIAEWYLGNPDQSRAGFGRAAMTEGFIGMLSRGYLRGIDGVEGNPMPDLDDDTAQWIATDWQYSLLAAEVYALAGDHDAAMRWLNCAVERGLVNYPFLSEFDLFLTPLKQRKDFVALLERVHAEWKRAAGGRE